MRRTWVRWTLMTLFVVALGFTFVNLGQWQLDRLDQRRDRNATTAEHENAPIQPFEEVFGSTIQDSDQWQRVEVRGTFLTDKQVQARYRSFDGRTGWELVTPLETTTGQTVLVDRGFVERPAGQDFPRVFPDPPAGEVQLTGYVRRNEQGKPNQMTPTENTVRLINSDTLSEALGLPLVNGYIALIDVTPAQSAELEPVTPPPPTEGPHWSYAMQWFAFTAIAAIGLVILIRNDIRDRKRANERAARSGGTPAGRTTTDTPTEATHGSRAD
ncbi:MAG TPA: SURF1 family protein [Propionibacterium sp.]|nr:SURF1 family protein [Propionibacterium sp.]